MMDAPESIQVIPAARRHFSDFGWLKTYWLFSFSEYYDPANIQFGALRVFNDDVVEPGGGFPTHPHREMEIVTVVLEGQVTHEDSLGNRAVIGPGEVQRMSAGRGITHSEFNLGDRAVHFCQIWLYPDIPGLEPSYDQRRFEPEEWADRLLPVASGRGAEGAVTFHTDATIFRAALTPGRAASHAVEPGRRAFLYLLGGALRAGGVALSAGDQARVDREGALELRADSPADLILIDVPSCKGFGYDRRTLRGARGDRRAPGAASGEKGLST